MFNWRFTVGRPINLLVYNLTGERVVVLINERQSAGFHQAEFDGSELASGIYYNDCRQTSI
jgi:hypothetical protein